EVLDLLRGDHRDHRRRLLHRLLQAGGDRGLHLARAQQLLEVQLLEVLEEAQLQQLGGSDLARVGARLARRQGRQQEAEHDRLEEKGKTCATDVCDKALRQVGRKHSNLFWRRSLAAPAQLARLRRPTSSSRPTTSTASWISGGATPSCVPNAGTRSAATTLTARPPASSVHQAHVSPRRYGPSTMLRNSTP